MAAKHPIAGMAEHTLKSAKSSAKPSPKRSYKAPSVKRDRKLSSVTGAIALSGQDG